MAEKRYFHALNANQKFSGSGRTFQFECYTLCGTWMGVFCAATEEDAAALSKLVEAPMSTITEIDQAEYDSCIKKKSSESPISAGLVASPQPNKGTGALLVAESGSSIDPGAAPTPTLAPGSKPVDSVEDALQIGKVR